MTGRSLTLDEIAELAQGWTLERVDSARWRIVDPATGNWAPMPRVVAHPQLGGDHGYDAQMAPRKIAAEALECYRRGVAPPLYRQTPHGLELVEVD